MPPATLTTPAATVEPSGHLDPKSLAALSFDVGWQDGDVTHEDHLFFNKFSVWRDSEHLPPELAQAIPTLTVGARVTAAYTAGALLPPWTDSDVLALPRAAFDGDYLRGRRLTPVVGRFYPRGIFHGHGGLVREEWKPARVTGLSEKSISVDLNAPLSRFPLSVGMSLEAILDGTDMRGGRCNNCIDDLLRGPGFMVQMTGENTPDFGLNQRPLTRPDRTPDTGFYSLPRLVQHLDTWCLQEVASLYARLLPASASVLDLMGSFDSHLEQAAPAELAVLGMNTSELDANPMAVSRTVQDLNSNPRLPYTEACFDAVVCTASVEYLTDPLAVFAEIRRILKPGGVFVNTFSNRWFPTKAIDLWPDLHEFERVAWLTEVYKRSGFNDLHTLSKRNWPRPMEDAYSAAQPFADPFFAVWGRRP
jgi:SAM-dependent methyltransferase